LSAILFAAAPLAANMVARFLSRCDGGNSCFSAVDADDESVNPPIVPPERKPANSRSCRVTEVSSTRAPEERREEEAAAVVVPRLPARWEELVLL
jgi:hypothetical protein